MSSRDDALPEPERVGGQMESSRLSSYYQSPRAAEWAAVRMRAGREPAAHFLGRLARLALDDLGRAVRSWHLLADASWFEAEDSVAQAVTRARRHPEQEVLLEQITRLFREAVWFKEEAPGARIGAAEPSAQYVATIAMIALLVRDHIDPDEFQLLYRPFAELIPLAELERE